MSQLHRPTSLSTVLTSLLSTSTATMSTTTPGRPIDMGSDAYLWRIQDQFLGARFVDCYKGPDFHALGAGEQRRRVQMYEKRRSDEFWYLWRAWARKVRWEVLKWLGYRPY